MVPLGALIAALLLRWPLRQQLSFGQLYGYALIGYLLSPLLDACTSYGTHLAWPFSTRPVALSIVPIIEPVLTLSVLSTLILALVRRQPAFARVGCAVVAAVLLLGFVQHERALAVAHDNATARNHAPERIMVKPTLGNLLLWRSLYLVNGQIHVDAVRVGLPGNIRIYPGENAPKLDPQRDLGLPTQSRLSQDVERFIAFTDGLPVRHPSRPEFIGDARYAMLPTSIEPLWGIVLDPAAPDTHARFDTSRKLTPQIRARFLDMLLGR
jgi:inner membrane protein